MKFILALSLLFTLASSVFAEAPAKEALCRACHGVNGAKPLAPNYPKLNGQNKAYLVAAMNAYKNGERKGALASVMTGQAKMLSDAEIEALADFYATK